MMRCRSIILAGLLLFSAPAQAQDILAALGLLGRGGNALDQGEFLLFRGLEWDQGTINALDQCRNLFLQMAMTVPAMTEEQAAGLLAKDSRVALMKTMCQEVVNISRQGRPQLPLIVTDLKTRRAIEKAAGKAIEGAIEDGTIPASELFDAREAGRQWPGDLVPAASVGETR